MTRRRITAVLATLAIATACHDPSPVTDTGYVGTWSRGNVRNVSIVSIAKRGDGYAFRWEKRSVDGKYHVLCDWAGACEERLNGRLVATYRFETSLAPDSGFLLVDCHESRTVPVKVDAHYIDELVVRDSGLTLWSYTLERDGKRYEGDQRPQRSFTKVSNNVAGVLPPDRSGP